MTFSLGSTNMLEWLTELTGNETDYQFITEDIKGNS